MFFSSEDIRDGEVRARAAIEQMAARSWRQCGDDNNATLSQLFSSFSAHSSVYNPVVLPVSDSLASPRLSATSSWHPRAVHGPGGRRGTLPQTTRVYEALPAARREPPNLLPLFIFMIIGPHLQRLIAFQISFLCL